MLDIALLPELPEVTTSFLKWAGILWLLHIVVLSFWVILQKRSPVATLGWILTLAFIPYVGFLIFHFLGPHRLMRQRFRRLRAHTAITEHSEYLQYTVPALKESQRTDDILQVTELIRNTTGFPLSTATSLELMVDGGQTYPAILDAIAKAKHHVHLEYYIFEPDHIGTAMRDLLIKKAKEGVEVRLLVDGLGSPNLKRSFVNPMTDAGIEFAYFHKPRLRSIIRPMVNFRTHRKIVICDGDIGFTGGLNITDDEDERIHPDTAYHDIHIKVAGNAVHWLQMIFIEDWFYVTNRQIHSKQHYFPIHETGELPAQIVPSGPDNPWEIIHRTYVTMIQKAERRIWLTTPYFVPTEPALFALSNAALRGVDVRILVPKRSDSKLVTLAARSYFEGLTKAGVKIWEYDERMLHSKTIVIDQDYSLIGTANFDNRSFRLNFEVCLAAYGPALANQLAEQFLKDTQSAKQVAKDRRIGFGEKLGESVARLFSPLL